ncbi:hypothetical protein [uncultured Methanospirillum sp.]|uniref:hypothetical protein n=1 Tax=uncultured Methanospirillum sp. TaxID=262503 RepID=UPI0029C7B72D|nr:hypothetical protein [uncultured Methanospirillum sp.]
MEKKELDSVAQAIVQFIRGDPKRYRSITNFKSNIPSKLRKQIGILKNSEDQDVIKIINSIKPQPFIYTKIFPRGERKYISTYTPIELCLQCITEYPQLTINQISTKLPFKKEELTQILNVLIKEGKIGIEIELKVGNRSKWVFKLKSEVTPITNYNSDRTELKRAYDNLERGRGYVEIYEIREHLKWERDQFDNLLETLWVQGDIVLQTSNQESLTQKQRDDSFLDRENTLRILLLWSGM